MTFVDIAGLVKGASKGEGLGNQFLANIREVDAIAHVLRCFEDGDVTHVEGRVDPVSDAETIETELMIADMESIEKRRAGLVRKLKGGDKEAVQPTAARRGAGGAGGWPAGARGGGRCRGRARLDRPSAPDHQADPLRVQRGRGERGRGQRLSAQVAEMAAAQGAASVVISARIEEEISQLDAEEAAMFLAEMGLEEPGLDRLIKAGYELLSLETYLHRRTQGDPRLDGAGRHPRPAGRRRDPRRFREGVHPRRNHRL